MNTVRWSASSTDVMAACETCSRRAPGSTSPHGRRGCSFRARPRTCSSTNIRSGSTTSSSAMQTARACRPSLDPPSSKNSRRPRAPMASRHRTRAPRQIHCGHMRRPGHRPAATVRSAPLAWARVGAALHASPRFVVAFRHLSDHYGIATTLLVENDVCWQHHKTRRPPPHKVAPAPPIIKRISASQAGRVGLVVLLGWSAVAAFGPAVALLAAVRRRASNECGAAFRVAQPWARPRHRQRVAYHPHPHSPPTFALVLFRCGLDAIKAAGKIL